ncbi:MAG TPA: hypothetical protein VGK93_12640 [Candidatus Eisenbacteria bacterium]|jgi:hypothetical protein
MEMLMKRVPTPDLIETQPLDAQDPKRPEAKPIAARAPGPPPGDVQSALGKAHASKPDAVRHSYRAVFVCATHPPERSGSEP